MTKKQAWTSYNAARRRGDVACDNAFDAGWAAAIEACRQSQPVTAENPNENTYQRGFFDGVIAYGRAIVSLRE